MNQEKLDYFKKYRETNRDKVQALDKKYKQKNKEWYKAYHKKYYTEVTKPRLIKTGVLKNAI